MDRIDLKGLTPRQIDRFCATNLGQKPGQGFRVAAWIFRKGAAGFDAMDDLNRPFRDSLKAQCTISAIDVSCTEASRDGSIKLLYKLMDGHDVEGVLIPGQGRLTLCVSTQVGCASACAFCLTGSGGFIRNLSASEIVNQVHAASAHAGGRDVSNIVLMGTGEPLSNYDAVTTFIETAIDPRGFALSPRRITISTCGLAPQIERLADDGVDVSLAVSLNATTDAVRDRIMPVNRAYPLSRLMQALHYYTEKTGRSVTIEYVLFEGVNDSTDDASRMIELTEGLPCMVNLLTFNSFPGCGFHAPAPARLAVFRDILVQASRITVVRKSRGSDVFAACGQLRASRVPQVP